MKSIDTTLDRGAWRVWGGKYLAVEKKGDAWSYTFLDKNLRKLDEGRIKQEESSPERACDSILKRLSWPRGKLQPVSYKTVMDRAGLIERKNRETRERMERSIPPLRLHDWNQAHIKLQATPEFQPAALMESRPKYGARKNSEPNPDTTYAASDPISRFLDSKSSGLAVLQLRSGETNIGEFLSYDDLIDFGRKPELGNYDVVYTGNLPQCRDREELLKQIRETYNSLTLENFYGRQIDVSDIIAVREDGAVTSYYVEPEGFRKLNGFLRRKQQVRKAGRTDERPQAEPSGKPNSRKTDFKGSYPGNKQSNMASQNRKQESVLPKLRPGGQMSMTDKLKVLKTGREER